MRSVRSARTGAESRSVPVALKPARLPALDAMRGVAALAVVLYHVPHELREAAGIPKALNAIASAGWVGVDAFFVLSGFVIAMSVSTGSWTVGYLGRFLARRSVRLDPSYWTAIAIELVLGWIGIRFLADVYSLPTVGGLMAHLVYLQGLLGIAQISDVFWTLCYEVQFYVSLVGSLVLATVVQRRTGISRNGMLRVLLVTVVVCSLAIRGGVISNPLQGLMLERAYQFALGIIAYLFVSGRTSAVNALLAIGGIEAARLVDRAYLEVAVSAVATAVCAFSARSEPLNRIASIRPLQFLGRISYSLYLYHASIVSRGATVVLMIAQGSSVALLPLAGLVGLIVGSIAFSYVMYRLVEAPTMKLCKRIPLTAA